MSSKKFFHSVVCHRRVKLRPHPTQVGSIVLVFGFVSDLKAICRFILAERENSFRWREDGDLAVWNEEKCIELASG